MPNNFVFPQWVAMEALRLLKNKLEIAQIFDTTWKKEFDQEFAVGESIQVKLPQRYLVTDGLGYQPQALNRLTTTIKCDQVMGIHFEIDDLERALKLERSKEEISKQYLEPAMAQLAQETDSRAALFAYQNTPNLVGVFGTDPTTMNPFQLARQRMLELACPAGGDKLMVIPPQVNTSLVPALASLFNPSSEISRQYKGGSIGKMSGYDWYESMSLYRHTLGTWAGAVTVNGGGQSGSSLIITATAGDTFNQGDPISIANVNLINPMTRRILQTAVKGFVVTQNLVAVGGGADVIQIYPPIYGPGSQYQNVDALPANSAALTLASGTASPNGKSGAQALAIHGSAFAMVNVKLYKPKAVEFASETTDPETGMSVRLVDAWDPVNSKRITRWDCVFGFGTLYAENCSVRIACA